MDNLLQRLEALEDEVRIVRRRLRLWRQLTGSVLVLMLVALLQPWGLAAQAPGEDPDRTLWQIVNLWGRVDAIERTLTHVTSVTGAGGLPEVRITGANLRLVNGLRATATANGLGNLLVGYNEPRQGGTWRRDRTTWWWGWGTISPASGGSWWAGRTRLAGRLPRSAAGSTIWPAARARRSAGGSLTEPVERAPRSAAGSTIRPAPAPPRSAAGEATRLAARAPPSMAVMEHGQRSYIHN